MSPDAYCEAKAAQSGSSFYYSFRFLPPKRRRAIIALYAFCREVDDVVDEVADPGVARLKLAWWRNEIAAVFGGEPQHPVALALVPTVAAFNLREEHLQAVIDGMTMDLDQNRYRDFATLERYCDRVAGVVGLMSAEIFGYEQPATRDYARTLGIAFQLTNIIRDVGEDASRGRIYLPQDELARHGLTAADLFGRRVTPAFTALMTVQVARARAFYARALAALPKSDRRAQRPGLIMAAIYQALLRAIERDGFRVLDRRISLSPLAKAWIAWKTSWSY
ncbi:MAG TPA: presqualene diphosphate synthase HpnD [Casimicrobiaceae bacterium]|jgi:phytoene synthase|nr:presqualene diphosphate synthase HpnD [Casimicrobiaceae bacterium]